MNKYLTGVAIAIFLFVCTSANATTRYVAQSAGVFSGGTACNGQTAISVATFNGTTNSAGDIDYLCGTITTTVNPTGNGSSGNPVTIKFDTGANISEPVCSTSIGCLLLSGHSYYLVDGQNTGIVQSTANGTGLANKTSSTGIQATPCNNCEIKNLTIQNIYVHTGTSDDGIDQTLMRCIFMSGSNFLVHDNTMHDAGFCVYNYWANGDSNVQIYNNNIYNVDHGVTPNGFGAVSTSHVWIYGNHIHDYANWDTADDAFHHDGIHAYGTSGAKITDLEIYDNQFDGNTGVNFTSQIYIEDPNNEGDMIAPLLVFNNTIDCSTPAHPNFGCLAVSALPLQTYNNTILGAHDTSNSADYCMLVDGGGGGTIKNNIMSGCDSFIIIYNNNFGNIVANNNTYAAAGGCPWNHNNGTCQSTIAAWRTTSGQEANSQLVSSANLASNYVPNAGSAAIAFGANLTSLAITPLNSDKAGNARPSSGAWDDGALNSGVAPPAVVIGISPVIISLSTGGTEQFTDTVTGTSNTAVNWKALDGTITLAGLYTAPSTAATDTVTVTSVADPTKSASATVTVTSNTPPPPVVTVAVSPTTALLSTNGTQQFTSTVTGSSNLSVTWTDTCGTVSASGLYTAPATAGTCTVTATSVADTTKSASARVTVTAPVTTNFKITSSPASLSFTGTVGGANPACQTLTVDDTTTNGPLPVNIGALGSWLSSSVTTGKTKLTTSVCVNISGFPAGTMMGDIVVTATGPNTTGQVVNNSPFSIPVTLKLTGVAPPPTITISCTTATSPVCTIKNLAAAQTVNVTVTNPSTGAVIATTTATQ